MIDPSTASFRMAFIGAAISLGCSPENVPKVFRKLEAREIPDTMEEMINQIKEAIDTRS